MTTDQDRSDREKAAVDAALACWKQGYEAGLAAGRAGREGSQTHTLVIKNTGDLPVILHHQDAELLAERDSLRAEVKRLTNIIADFRCEVLKSAKQAKQFEETRTRLAERCRSLEDALRYYAEGPGKEQGER